MKNSPFLIIIVLVVACSKENQTNKKIAGSWKPVTLKIADLTGIGVYVEASGTIEFNPSNKKSKTGEYTIDIRYQENSEEHLLFEKGTYEIQGEELIRKTPDGLTLFSKIKYVNKTDLEFEIPNINTRLFNFVLEK